LNALQFFKKNKFKDIYLIICMLYYVNVEFNKDFCIVKENHITLGIKSRPIKGEANKEIIKKIGKHFGISTSFIQIKSGKRSKQKIIEILN